MFCDIIMLCASIFFPALLMNVIDIHKFAMHIGELIEMNVIFIAFNTCMATL